jgi:NAD-dependent deacetylase
MGERRIFILTGAGVSAESGLQTFRDKDGLWAQFDLEDLATPAGFARNPRLVLEFYNARRARLAGAQPNAAHFALAELERACTAAGGSLTVCTQNIDDLHERAGARRVLHMHGELTKARCNDCAAVFPYEADLWPEMGCEVCGRIGGLRPHVVWFGEMPLHLDEIYAALAAADLFAAIGTSGAVYPAAGFVASARRAGIPTVELNLAPSDNASLFDERIYGPAAEMVPAWVAKTIAAA